MIPLASGDAVTNPIPGGIARAVQPGAIMLVAVKASMFYSF